jgi:hypothetical protein
LLRREIVRKLDVRRTPGEAPHLIADSVDDRLAQVCLHGAHMPRLERIEPGDGVHRGILHQIAGIEVAAGRRRQSAVSPALQ